MPQPFEAPDNPPESNNLPLWRLLYFSLAILILQAVAGYFIYASFVDWPERSHFGSMFGAVGTVFSGFAFAGVIYAILLQRRDLELQRKELELTREELSRSAAAQERSERALVEQARMMEITAKLTALNFLAEASKARMEFLSTQGRDYKQERERWNDIMNSLEELTSKLEDGSPRLSP